MRLGLADKEAGPLEVGVSSGPFFSFCGLAILLKLDADRFDFGVEVEDLFAVLAAETGGDVRGGLYTALYCNAFRKLRTDRLFSAASNAGASGSANQHVAVPLHRARFVEEQVEDLLVRRNNSYTTSTTEKFQTCSGVTPFSQ